MAWLLSAVIVVLSLTVLGVALLGAYRQVRELARELGRAGDAVAEAGAQLSPDPSVPRAGPARRTVDGH